jgi:putative FmdB family regulatory protein
MFMPVYEYKCVQHGLFFELATMDEAHKPSPCPTCSAMAARVIMINPAFLDMPQAIKQAHTVNEKAQHAPEHSTKARREDDHQHKKAAVAKTKNPAHCSIQLRVKKCSPPRGPG